MIIKALRAIRQKPKHVRDQFAFWIAASCTGMVALIWTTQLGGGVIDSAAIQPAAVVESNNTLSTFLEDTKATFSELGDALPSESDASQSNQSDDDMQNIVNQLASPSTQSQTNAQSEVQPTARTVRIATTSASTTQ